jgi:hypothetical protein
VRSVDAGRPITKATRRIATSPSGRALGDATFKEFPPSQKTGSFSLDQRLNDLQR